MKLDSNLESTRHVVVSARIGGRPDGAKAVTAALVTMLEQRTTVETIDRSNEEGGVLQRLWARCTTEARVAGALVRGARADTGVALYRELSCVNGMSLDVVIATVATLLRVPMYAHLHSWSTAVKPARATRLIFRLNPAARVIVLSDRMASTVVESLAISPSRVVVGVNRGLIGRCDESERDDPERDETTRPLCLGLLSNLIPGKGTEYFVDLAEMGPSAWTYALAGPIGDNAIVSLVDRFSRLDTATYLGPLYGDDKEDFFRRCDVFVFPSQYSHEAWPLVVEEALARGCYVIASDVGLLESQLDNPLMGTTIPAIDLSPKALVTAIQQALESGLLSRDCRQKRVAKWVEGAALAQVKWTYIADSIAGLPADTQPRPICGRS